MPLAAAGGGGSGRLGADVIQPRKAATSGTNLAERTGLEPDRRKPKIANNHAIL